MHLSRSVQGVSSGGWQEARSPKSSAAGQQEDFETALERAESLERLLASGGFLNACNFLPSRA